MTWVVRFIPNQADSVEVNINNEFWTTWESSEGLVDKVLPDKWKELVDIKISCSAFPEDRNASVRVFWDTELKQIMDFDDTEDHDVNRFGENKQE